MGNNTMHSAFYEDAYVSCALFVSILSVDTCIVGLVQVATSKSEVMMVECLGVSYVFPGKSICLLNSP